jgi:inorganic pyrophosphatase
LIGAITAEQSEKKKKIINDRFLAVPIHGQLLADIKSIEDLPEEVLKELEDFFINYNQIENKQFKPLKRLPPKEAHKLLKQNNHV